MERLSDEIRARAQDTNFRQGSCHSPNTFWIIYININYIYYRFNTNISMQSVSCTAFVYIYIYIFIYYTSMYQIMIIYAYSMIVFFIIIYYYYYYMYIHSRLESIDTCTFKYDSMMVRIGGSLDRRALQLKKRLTWLAPFVWAPQGWGSSADSVKPR